MAKEDANGGEGTSNDVPATLEQLNEKADELSLADSSESGVQEAAKKKKNKSKRKKETKEQSDPPSIPVAELFAQGNFPEGEIQQYKDDNLWRTTSEEKRDLERLEKPMDDSIRQAAEVHRQVVMGPRWKGKGSEVKALANPISRSILDLQVSLISSSSQGILTGCSVLLASNPEQTDLLNQTCFGRSVITVDKDKQWFQFTFEEAFYLCFYLKCIKIVGSDCSIKTHKELWKYMTTKRVSFPDYLKAYSHLRVKNWVVRSGCQYGVDFVAYRHHPSLVHSEFGVLVFPEGNGNGNCNNRLRVWSDFQCTLRLCGSVAKTLLILHVNRNGENETASSPSCLDGYSVEERTITRWSSERSREDQTVGTK